MQTFLKKNAFTFGWHNFKLQPWFLIGLFLTIFVISGIVSGLESVLEDNGMFLFLVNIAGTVLEWWIYTGILLIMLNIYDKKPVEFGDLFSQRGVVLWNYILGTILYSLIVLGGLLLLIVPGVVWSVKYHYYAYLIVDKKMKPLEAIKQSGVLTNGHKGNVLVFFILGGLLNILGVLALGVGMLVTIPVTVLANTYVYRWLDGGSPQKDKSGGAGVETLQDPGSTEGVE